MRFLTLSGSLYEIDTAQRRIRCLTGSSAARVGKGEWRDYQETQPAKIQVGAQVLIVWASVFNPDGPKVPEGTLAQTTLTSMVVSIEPDQPVILS